MWYKELFQELMDSKNQEKASGMSAYMRNQFAYLGIQTSKRKEITKKYFKIAKKELVDWTFINECWEKPEREFQYVALDYLKILKDKLTPGDIDKLKILATTKSWWDTIDCLDRIIGSLALKNSELNSILLKWSVDENIWLRRIAIDHQLDRKEKTDTDLLEKIIVNNLNHTEFFINKAIGWSLRQYSKINADWVRNFIERHKENMASLSIKEASKYI